MVHLSFTGKELQAWMYLIGGSMLFFLQHLFGPQGIASWLAQAPANAFWLLPVFIVTLVHLIRNPAISRRWKFVLGAVMFVLTVSLFPIYAPIYLLWQVKQFSRSTRITATVAALFLALLHGLPEATFMPRTQLYPILYSFYAACAVLLVLVIRNSFASSRVQETAAPGVAADQTALHETENESSAPSPNQTSQAEGQAPQDDGQTLQIPADSTQSGESISIQIPEHVDRVDREG